MKVLTFSTTSFHFPPSWTQAIQFLMFIWQISCLMLSFHLYSGLPCDLLVRGFHLNIYTHIYIYISHLKVNFPLINQYFLDNFSKMKQRIQWKLNLSWISCSPAIKVLPTADVCWWGLYDHPVCLSRVVLASLSVSYLEIDDKPILVKVFSSVLLLESWNHSKNHDFNFQKRKGCTNAVTIRLV